MNPMTQTSVPPSAEILTIPEIARILRVGKNTAYALTARKDFPAIRVGRQIRVSRAAFNDWLKRECGKSA